LPLCLVGEAAVCNFYAVFFAYVRVMYLFAYIKPRFELASAGAGGDQSKVSTTFTA